MKTKRFALFLVLIMAVSCFSALGVSAAGGDTDLTVRVNGKLTEFPDAKPYIDGSNRTMIPVRFVAENLGAEVTWTGATKTASIMKDNILVEVTIGDQTLRVTDHGKTRTVAMDTAAVLKENRTYVPIRFVAEALGAYVDYSSTYHTVGIYSDVLTAEQISMLTSLPYTQPKEALGYEEAKERYDADTLAFLYGTDRDGFQSFANAREHLYHMTSESNVDEYYADVVRQAADAVDYDSKNLTVRFLADTSCVYQSDSMDRLTCAVRGIAVVQLKVSPLELTGSETAMLCALGFKKLAIGTMCIPVDIHMNAGTGRTVSLHTIAPAGDQY